MGKRKGDVSTKEDTAKKLIQSSSVLKDKIKTVLKRSPEPALALSVVFEMVGFEGVSGIGWGVLAGIVISVAIELGYEIRQIGGRYFLFKQKNRRNLQC